MDQVRGWGDKASTLAKEYGPSFLSQSKKAAARAGKSASKSAKRLGRQMPGTGGFGAGSVIGTAASCAAVGALTMYFFDPNRGRARRAYCEQQIGGFVRKTGRSMRATGVHVANRVRGMSHEASRSLRDSANDTASLIARVRAELGHWVSNPKGINVSADPDGSVTLSGMCSGSESHGLLGAIAKVPGICQIINRLDVREQGENGASSSASRQATGV
jgi:hypothetical protein